MDITLIDCDTCRARGESCHDCVLSVVLELSPPGIPLGALCEDERRAVEVLAEHGLIAPLDASTTVGRAVG